MDDNLSETAIEFGIEQWKAILNSLKHIATLSTACIVAFSAIGKNFGLLDSTTIKVSIGALIFTIICSVIAHVFFIATFARDRNKIETIFQGWSLLFCWIAFIVGLSCFAIGFYAST